MRTAEEIKIDMMEGVYDRHFHDCHRKVGKKRLQKCWASLYEHELDTSPCQSFSFVYHHFILSETFDEFERVFRIVEERKLNK